MSKTDRYRIDSHKLHLHPRRVADWLEGKDIAPIYMEISPSGACNHRCRFCALDFMEYKKCFLPTDTLSARLEEMGRAGVKSVMYAGEGEPFLHKDMAAIAKATRAAGIDVAFTTNAVLLRPEIAREILPVTSWIKVSCNAGTPETYSEIHGTKAGDFGRVMENMAKTVALRKELGAACSIGVQMVLLPDNQREVIALARQAQDIGVDYLVIKPYSQHPQSHTKKYSSVSYEDAAIISRQLEEMNTSEFSTIFRYNTIERHMRGVKKYDCCQALPFWSYMDAEGGIWGCSVFLGDKNFFYGNALAQTFDEIWHGKKRRESLAWCASNLDASQCRINCRMDAINEYLWELAHPGGHVNFI